VARRIDPAGFTGRRGRVEGRGHSDGGFPGSASDGKGEGVFHRRSGNPGGSLRGGDDREQEVYDEGERTYGIDVHPTSPKETLYLTDAVETAPQQGPVEYNHQIVHLSGKVTKVFLRPGNTMESQLPKTLKMLLSARLELS